MNELISDSEIVDLLLPDLTRDDLLALSRTNQRLRKLLQQDYVWESRFRREFPDQIAQKRPDQSWRDLYLRLSRPWIVELINAVKAPLNSEPIESEYLGRYRLAISLGSFDSIINQLLLDSRDWFKDHSDRIWILCVDAELNPVVSYSVEMGLQPFWHQADLTRIRKIKIFWSTIYWTIPRGLLKDSEGRYFNIDYEPNRFRGDGKGPYAIPKPVGFLDEMSEDQLLELIQFGSGLEMLSKGELQKLVIEEETAKNRVNSITEIPQFWTNTGNLDDLKEERDPIHEIEDYFDEDFDFVDERYEYIDREDVDQEGVEY